MVKKWSYRWGIKPTPDAEGGGAGVKMLQRFCTGGRKTRNLQQQGLRQNVFFAKGMVLVKKRCRPKKKGKNNALHILLKNLRILRR